MPLADPPLAFQPYGNSPVWSDSNVHCSGAAMLTATTIANICLRSMYCSDIGALRCSYYPKLKNTVTHQPAKRFCFSKFRSIPPEHEAHLSRESYTRENEQMDDFPSRFWPSDGRT